MGARRRAGPLQEPGVRWRNVTCTDLQAEQAGGHVLTELRIQGLGGLGVSAREEANGDEGWDLGQDAAWGEQRA